MNEYNFQKQYETLKEHQNTKNIFTREQGHRAVPNENDKNKEIKDNKVNS